jgi:hypothetical protein
MKKFLKLLILLSLSCLLILSCSSNWTKNCGTYAENDDIKILFETHEYVSDYNYFYTGYIKSPEAIVGIERDFDLVKNSGWGIVTNWQKFDPSGEKLKELVEAMRNPGRPYGYMINAPDGEQVGVMYTKKWGNFYTPEIRFKSGNQLEVTPHKYNSTFAPS